MANQELLGKEGTSVKEKSLIMTNKLRTLERRITTNSLLDFLRLGNKSETYLDIKYSLQEEVCLVLVMPKMFMQC